MFGSARNAISAYQKVGVDAAIEVADPHRLILLLFAGAQAAIGNACGDEATADRRQGRSDFQSGRYHQQPGLKVSLDLETGGEIAGRLDALYDYLVLRLLRANLDNDLAALEVAGLLEEIHGAWREISPSALQQAVA